MEKRNKGEKEREKEREKKVVRRKIEKIKCDDQSTLKREESKNVI